MIPDATSNLPDMDSIQVVSWDVDGTLYSTRRAAWHAGMRALGSTIRRRRLDPLWELAELRELWRRVEQARFDAQNPVGVHENSRRRRELEEQMVDARDRGVGSEAGGGGTARPLSGTGFGHRSSSPTTRRTTSCGVWASRNTSAPCTLASGWDSSSRIRHRSKGYSKISVWSPSACSTSATGWTRTAPERRPPAVGHSSFERTFVRSGNSIRCWLAACGETLTAFDRRCIPAELRCSSVTYREYARSSRLVSRAPRRSRCDAGFHHRLLDTPTVPRPREFCLRRLTDVWPSLNSRYS